MDQLSTVQGLGITLPSPAYVFGIIFFGALGLAAFGYGRKAQRPRVKWLGVALMLYPYAVYSTRMLYAVGIGLCAAIYFWRE